MRLITKQSLEQVAMIFWNFFKEISNDLKTNFQDNERQRNRDIQELNHLLHKIDSKLNVRLLYSNDCYQLHFYHSEYSTFINSYVENLLELCSYVFKGWTFHFVNSKMQKIKIDTERNYIYQEFLDIDLKSNNNKIDELILNKVQITEESIPLAHVIDGPDIECLFFYVNVKELKANPKDIGLSSEFLLILKKYINPFLNEYDLAISFDDKGTIIIEIEIYEFLEGNVIELFKSLPRIMIHDESVNAFNMFEWKIQLIYDSSNDERHSLFQSDLHFKIEKDRRLLNYVKTIRYNTQECNQEELESTYLQWDYEDYEKCNSDFEDEIVEAYPYETLELQNEKNSMNNELYNLRVKRQMYYKEHKDKLMDYGIQIYTSEMVRNEWTEKYKSMGYDCYNLQLKVNEIKKRIKELEDSSNTKG